MFKNPTILHDISQEGFAIVDANLYWETEQLYSYISNHFNFPSSDFYYSLLENTFEENKILQNVFKEILLNFYEAHFTNYRTINESFLAKPANTTDELLLHQDWCYTDEKKYTAYNIWIPLQDVTKTKGAMFFLPGSHLWFNNLRSASLPTARINTADFLKQHKQTVALKKGQALIFHPAVFHGSYPNLSTQNRIVATVTILEKAAPFLYFQQTHNKDKVRVFQLNDETFLKNLKRIAIGCNPDSPEINRLKYTHHIVNKEDLKSKLSLENL